MQASQQQLVHDCDRKLAGATEAERAIGRAMTTQVESLQRQVASLTLLQAENEALKAVVEVILVLYIYYIFTLWLQKQGKLQSSMHRKQRAES